MYVTPVTPLAGAMMATWKQAGRPRNGIPVSLRQAMRHRPFGIKIFNYPNGPWFSGGGDG
jgi:hypothetical protein